MKNLGYKALQVKRDERNNGLYIKALGRTFVVKEGNLQVIDQYGLETFYVDKAVFKALGGIIFAWGLTIALGVL